MDELMILPKDKELVAQMHSGGEELPLPFNEHIFLLELDFGGAAGGNKDSIASVLMDGDSIRLVREPENPGDPNAIRIELDSGLRLGYIPKQFSVILARLMDAGKKLYGVVRERKNAEGDKRIVVRIYMKDEVYRSADIIAAKASADISQPSGAQDEPGHENRRNEELAEASTKTKDAANNGGSTQPITMDSEELKGIIHAILDAAEKLWPYVTPAIRAAVRPEDMFLSAVKRELSVFVIYVSRACKKPVPQKTLHEYVQTDLSTGEIDEIAASYSPARFNEYLLNVPKCFRIWTDIDYDVGYEKAGNPSQFAMGYFNAIKSVANILLDEISPLDEDTHKGIVMKLLPFFNMIEISIDGDVAAKRRFYGTTL